MYYRVFPQPPASSLGSFLTSSAERSMSDIPVNVKGIGDGHYNATVTDTDYDTH